MTIFSVLLNVLLSVSAVKDTITSKADTITNRSKDTTTNKAEDITTNEAKDTITTKAEDIITKKLEDTTNNKAKDTTTNKAKDTITSRGNDNDYHATDQPLQQGTLNIEAGQSYSNMVMTIKTIYTSTINTVGVISNTLSVVIIIKQDLIKSGVWVYIASLAIVDNVGIIYYQVVNFSRDPINYLGDFITISEFSCKLNSLLIYFPMVTSHYILAIMTIQRSIIITNPYKIAPGQRHAVTVVVLLILIVLLVYGTYCALTTSIVELPIPFPANDLISNVSLSVKFCGIHLKYKNIQDIIMISDVVAYAIIPAILVIIANVCIIIALIRRQQNTSIQRDLSKVKEDNRIARMLIFLSIYFVVMTFPHALYYAINVDVAGAFDPGNIVYNVLECITATYYCSTFFVYLATGQIFRKEAEEFFTKLCTKCNLSARFHSSSQGTGSSEGEL